MRGMAAVCPGWVIAAPSVEAITAEENVEVRRCAIESLGWDRFIAEQGSCPSPRARRAPGYCARA